MTRYIDADKLCKGLKDMAKYQNSYKQSTILGVVSTIENTPTADVVEVVRCQHCRFVSITQPDGTIHCGRESVMGVGTVFRKADDFCSYGKRKEDEGK